MRFYTIIAAASTLALLTASSSAQEVPALENMAACQTCINQVGPSASPACKGLENSQGNPSGNLSDKQKACLCGMIANKEWASSCVQPDKCPASIIQSLNAAAEALNAKDGICAGLSATSAAVGGAGGAKVAAAGAAAAMVIAGALL
ncbi:hypothetical protein BGW39_006383 [Mortierella sp. 14UC]|nr:hypothetical protein BGW39_006383 [Mortierella sp. 14UC]